MPLQARAGRQVIPADLPSFGEGPFTAFEAGRTDHTAELDSTATKLGRFAGRAFAEMKRRANNRE